MRIKKNVFWAVLILLIIVIAGYFMISSDKGSDIDIINGDVQVVKMHAEGSKYVFEPSTVVKGKPVRLEADISRMPGCSKSIISSELGIRKTVTSSDNSITFTPTKAGTFYIACSMNMYSGNLIVTESNGTASAYVEESKTTGMTCGGSGGCGCGG